MTTILFVVYSDVYKLNNNMNKKSVAKKMSPKFDVNAARERNFMKLHWADKDRDFSMPKSKKVPRASETVKGWANELRAKSEEGVPKRKVRWNV